MVRNLGAGSTVPPPSRLAAPAALHWHWMAVHWAPPAAAGPGRRPAAPPGASGSASYCSASVKSATATAKTS